MRIIHCKECHYCWVIPWPRKQKQPCRDLSPYDRDALLRNAKENHDSSQPIAGKDTQEPAATTAAPNQPVLPTQSP